MKMRLDFVTNSSSMSFIISMDADMADFFKKKNEDFRNDPAKARIWQLLNAFLEDGGERVRVGEADLLVKPRRFEKKTDCLYDDPFGDDPLGDNPNVNPACLSDADLWRYIQGEYLVRGRLASEFKGFGSVQVPRDRARIREKYCQHATCDDCDRQGTSRCHALGS